MKKLFIKLKSIFNSKTAKVCTFTELLDTFMKKEIVENKLTKSTQYKYAQLLKNITNFLKSRQQLNIPLSDFKISVGEALVYYLHDNLQSCSRTHSARHIEMCKRVLDYAVRLELIEYNPLAAIETRRDRVKQVVHLDTDEIKLLREHDFKTELLCSVRDLYLFQCETGLSYADLYSYKKTTDKDGTEWLYNLRKKNDSPYYVPLFSLAKIIYEKYNGQLPRFLNGTYNRLLKEVTATAGINKHLTSHTARKTFATIKNEQGYSTESIKDMLGQKSVKTTETHYIRVNRKRIFKEVLLHENGYLPPAA